MKPYVRPFPSDWWLKRFGWASFMVREVTCVAVAFYAVLLLVLLSKQSQGELAYRDYIEFIQAPGMVLIHGLFVLLLMFHSVTWFVATPKAVAIRIGENKVPDHQVIGGNIGGWVVLTAGLVWFFCFYLGS